MTRIAMYVPAAIDRAVDVMAAVARVTASGHYILGGEVRRFEEAFADFCGVSACVGVGNGTDAIEIALRALEVAPGDSVAMVANAGPYASAAARACGAQPLYVDIDPVSRTMAVEALRGALADSRPAAIVVTHLYGQLADIDGLSRLAQAAGIPLVEDCAQAHGARRDGKRAGSFGAIGTFSFYPTKNLPAVGDGGACVTSDEQLAERMRRLRQYGWAEKYAVVQGGGRNSRLDEVQAAVLHDRLARLEDWNGERRAIASRYVRGMAGMPAQLPLLGGDDYVAHLFVPEVDDRTSLREYLAARDIETAVHFPIPDHRQRAYVGDGQLPGNLTATERSCARVVSLLLFPGMPDIQIDTVLGALGGYFESR
jgi:aminotransferase EvaB